MPVLKSSSHRTAEARPARECTTSVTFAGATHLRVGGRLLCCVYISFNSRFSLITHLRRNTLDWMRYKHETPLQKIGR